MKTSRYNELRPTFIGRYGEQIKVEYVLSESTVIKLFEMFGSQFPDETLENWHLRFVDNEFKLAPLNISPYKPGGNKHLILTILYLALPYMNVRTWESYVSKKWGLKGFFVDVNRRVHGGNEVINHPDKERIKKILFSEDF